MLLLENPSLEYTHLVIVIQLILIWKILAQPAPLEKPGFDLSHRGVKP